MLILTRKIGESVVIGEEVYCTVLGYRDDEVRLAFDAPLSLPVHRDEIQRRIYQERQKDKWFTDSHPNRESIVERLIRKFKPALKSAQRQQ